MKISATLAKKIVEQLKTAIPYQLNFMSAAGVIIASTDESRIGAYHEGSFLAINNRSTVIIHYDGELQGARKGINLPVWFDEEVIGSVGITGEPDDVKHFGRIIVEMTSILIREAWLNEFNLRERERNNLVIEALITDPRPENHPYVQSYFIGKWPGECLVISGALESESSTESDEENSELLYKLAHRCLSPSPKQFFMVDRLKTVLVLPILRLEKARGELKNLQNMLFERHGKHFYTGIGSRADTLQEIAQSYNNSMIALRGAMRQKQDEVFYSEMDVEILTTALPGQILEQFIYKVLGELSTEELEEYEEILRLYEEHNGSITQTAAALFIHKNTLQYKLNRLHARSGYNPRHLRDFICLRLAFQMRRESEQQPLQWAYGI